MTVPATFRSSHVTSDRSEALGRFFQSAGEAPRLIAYDEEMGCPLHNALAALEWTVAVGILDDSDLLHAARLSGETAAAAVERRRDGRRIFLYLGPRVDAPPADPYEGSLLYDEPGVRAYEFGSGMYVAGLGRCSSPRCQKSRTSCWQGGSRRAVVASCLRRQ
jgi:hypothetical protein